jgi:MFS family permease
MKPWIKKAGICYVVMAASAAITSIIPFFPEIAVERGIPEWSLGLIFAVCPLVSLLTTLKLPFLLEKAGRKTIMMIGIFLLAMSNFIMALVWYSEGFTAIFESIGSRVLAGVGNAFSMMSANAAATSDFTEGAAQMIAMMEICCGLGLILGPAFASTIYGLMGFVYSCFIVGGLIVASLTVLYFILDNSRSYVIVNRGERIKLRTILMKPVRFI